MTTTIIIRKTFGGYTVARFKTSGLQKGETSLGSFCGGQLGRILAIGCARTAADFCLADEVVLEGMAEGTIRGEEQILEAMYQSEGTTQKVTAADVFSNPGGWMK
jgi:hypothetical protein